MSVLVTGITGYIGSHTAVSLMQAKESIVGLDNFSNSSADVPGDIEKITGAGFPFYKADVRDKSALEQIIRTHNISCVIHFAGLKAAGDSVNVPLDYYDNNVAGMIALLAAMEGTCARIIFSSSATVYDPSGKLPFNEDSKTGPINPYGQTKLMCEQILRDYARANKNFCAVALRYFNPVGAHKSGIIGENPRGTPTNLVPFIAQTAMGQQSLLRVFGDDYPTLDGTCIRDYIHIEDLAHGHILAHKFSKEAQGFHAINLGTGVGSSVLEVLAAYEAACGKKIPMEFAPRRAGDAAVSYAACEKAERLLGFRATRTLVEMCGDSYGFALARC